MNAGGMKLLEICDLQPLIGSSWVDFWQGADRECCGEPPSKQPVKAGWESSW